MCCLWAASWSVQWCWSCLAATPRQSTLWNSSWRSMQSACKGVFQEGKVSLCMQWSGLLAVKGFRDVCCGLWDQAHPSRPQNEHDCCHMFLVFVCIPHAFSVEPWLPARDSTCLEAGVCLMVLAVRHRACSHPSVLSNETTRIQFNKAHCWPAHHGAFWRSILHRVVTETPVAVLPCCQKQKM